jgi:hypothetical protein
MDQPDTCPRRIISHELAQNPDREKRVESEFVASVNTDATVAQVRTQYGANAKLNEPKPGKQNLTIRLFQVGVLS